MEEAVIDQTERGPYRVFCGRSSLPTDVPRALGQAALLAWLGGDLLYDRTAARDVRRPRSADHVTVEVRGVDPR